VRRMNVISPLQLFQYPPKYPYLINKGTTVKTTFGIGRTITAAHSSALTSKPSTQTAESQKPASAIR